MLHFTLVSHGCCRCTHWHLLFVQWITPWLLKAVQSLERILWSLILRNSHQNLTFTGVRLLFLIFISELLQWKYLTWPHIIFVWPVIQEENKELKRLQNTMIHFSGSGWKSCPCCHLAVAVQGCAMLHNWVRSQVQQDHAWPHPCVKISVVRCEVQQTWTFNWPEGCTTKRD